MANSNGNGPRGPTDEAVVFENVLVARRSELGWHCVIDGRDVFLGQFQLAAGATMPREGERGRVALTETAAHDLNLRFRQA